MAVTSAILLARSAFGLLGGFFARIDFLAGLALLVRFVFGRGTSGADAFFSDSVAGFISFLLTGLRS